MNKKIQESIEVNLPGLWEELEATDHGNLDMEALCEFYRGVIGNMVESYAEQYKSLLEDIYQEMNQDSVDTEKVYGLLGEYEQLKEEEI